MRYTYTGNGAYMSGLPANDLDDADLSENQQALLSEAIDQGLYTVTKSRSTKPDQKAPSAPTQAPASPGDPTPADMPTQSTTGG